MGDYGFGVLVQNNTGNKSAFPVRIHPHLQPPHHHQNATPSPAAFINSTAAGNGSNGSSPWLFPAAAAHSNMQDEILGSEKPKAQQQELQETQEKQQQLSPGHQEGGIISELEKVRSEESKVESGASEGANGKEKLRLESPVLTAFDYQEPSGLGTAVQSSTSSSLTSFNNWSAAIPPTPSTIINEDISFFNPASANNGPLLFQNFSHHVSPGFGGNFSPQIGPISQHHPPHPHFQHPHNQHQQHRRSPASPHPPPFPHRNAAFGQLPHLSNNLSKPPSPWGSYQSPSPSPSSTSWSPGGGYGSWGGSRGGEFRRGLNGGMTPLNSISPLKKTFPNNHVPSQKYSRTSPGFNPKSWMDESINRSENIFPFQNTVNLDYVCAEVRERGWRFYKCSLTCDLILHAARNYGRRRGKDQTFDTFNIYYEPIINNKEISAPDRLENEAIYSVFIFSDEITASFRRFGPLFVDWPHKAESKSYFPPKGKSRSSIISQTLDRVFSRAGRYGPKKKKI
uniref:Cytoplasmic polyadenylation element binding protein 4 n=1 Tax=Astyanax mexicanus TaxID=7994 RepID=A0A8B9GRT7_ASTMX